MRVSNSKCLGCDVYENIIILIDLIIMIYHVNVGLLCSANVGQKPRERGTSLKLV